MPTLYETLGHDRGIRAAVDEFYDRLLADRRLAHYFVAVDVARLRWHQAALLAALTGGPSRYPGRDLATAHAGLGITDEDFDLVVGHLVAALQQRGVGAEAIGQVGTALLAYREQVVDAAGASSRPTPAA